MNTRSFLVATVALAALTGTAAADGPHRTTDAIDEVSRVSLVDRQWARPIEPIEQAPISPIAIRALQLGNDVLGRSVSLASADLVDFQIDAPNRGVKLSVGGGDARYAQLRVSSDIAMVDGAARIATRVRLGVANQTIAFRMPVFEVAPASYHRERGVEVRLPLVRTQF